MRENSGPRTRKLELFSELCSLPQFPHVQKEDVRPGNCLISLWLECVFNAKGMFHIEVPLPWQPFDPKMQGLRFTYILHGDGQIWLPVLEAALAQMSAWKHLSVECDFLQLRRRGEGPWVTHSLPPRLPHFCRLDWSVSSSMTPSSLSDGVCVDKACTEGQQPSPQVPASLCVREEQECGITHSAHGWLF